MALGIAACSAPRAEQASRELPRIVSLNPCTDAILVEVADPQQVLALSHYSQDPNSTSMELEKAQQYRSISGTVEEVSALDPDVILASSFISPATSAALADLGFSVERFGIASEIDASFEQIRQIAAVAGHPERGEALIERIEQALAANAAGAGERSIATVLWQPGEIVPGEQALISHLMRNAGFASHSAALGLGQADYLSLEQLLAMPPDLLLIAGASRGQRHPALARLKETKVAALDPTLLYCGGPTIIRAAERLAAIRQAMS
ncbi:ABC transporter substrate-binding protein [Altererythrobacter arenosus]|uniref:ABC transporter substrate-binding protein n=1 Tax=Altererythrobacter arenosus TaxID=3032592 RepID=A0ABY8FTF3_9SPHN|nr:ABC transporter substrate-binding protein [Altererythrobacter sp. CAU 1644]WFL76696.1 ABC transporter substrate-binding protein [Altererythrobacter sp. CAU 1644]